MEKPIQESIPEAAIINNITNYGCFNATTNPQIEVYPNSANFSFDNVDHQKSDVSNLDSVPLPNSYFKEGLGCTSIDGLDNFVPEHHHVPSQLMFLCQ
ncbi:hypothetical protein HK096_001988, partial [Nowakowskiella sp. JEL0078]